MQGSYYILDEDRNMVATDFDSWQHWFTLDPAESGRLIHLTPTQSGLQVSTVFLGMDYSFGTTRNPSVPMFFETMVFGSDGAPDNWDRFTVRYSTLAEAQEGHIEVLARVIHEERAAK